MMGWKDMSELASHVLCMWAYLREMAVCICMNQIIAQTNVFRVCR